MLELRTVPILANGQLMTNANSRPNLTRNWTKFMISRSLRLPSSLDVLLLLKTTYDDWSERKSNIMLDSILHLAVLLDMVRQVRQIGTAMLNSSFASLCPADIVTDASMRGKEKREMQRGQEKEEEGREE